MLTADELASFIKGSVCMTTPLSATGAAGTKMLAPKHETATPGSGTYWSSMFAWVVFRDSYFTVDTLRSKLTVFKQGA